MKRRDFITIIGGSAVAWPLAARAQQGERVRRIGVILPASPKDAVFQARLGAFLQGLRQAGWAIDQNIRIDTRWATPNVTDIRRHAMDLVATAPDVILAHGSSTVGPILQATRVVPIVFPVAADPVAAGFVDSLARPGGNVTGFTSSEYSMSGKWLELLKEIAPTVTRATVFRNPATPSGPAAFAVIQAAAATLRMEVVPVNTTGNANEIERSFATMARTPNGGLIVTSGPGVQFHRDLIIAQAKQFKVPTVYYEGSYVPRGGLISYGPDLAHQFRLAAGYVDRILKGVKPADLPVQNPTKFELAINLKAAREIGLTVSHSLLTRADKVIE